MVSSDISNRKIDSVPIYSQNSSPSLFMISNPDGTIIDASESALTFFDLTREEIINRYTLWDFFCIPSSIKGLISSDEDTSKRDGEHIIAGIVRHPKDRFEFPSEIFVRRLRIGDQDIILIIFNHNKEWGQENQSENTFEEGYRECTEGIRDILYSARQDGTITFISPQVSRYGYNPQDFISRKLFDFIHEEDKERFLAEFQASFWTEGSSLSEFRIRDSSGNIYFFEDNHGSWTNITGETFEVSGVLRDISNRKQSEKGSQLMEKRLDLLSNITRHEILNQLYILHGSNAILQEYVSDPMMHKLLERQEQAIQNIHKQIEIVRMYQERGGD